MRKLPNKSDMQAMEQEEQEKRPYEKPAKKVMQAIGKSVLNPKAKKKAPKVKNGPSTQNTKKQNRQDVIEKSKDADMEE